MSKEPITKEQRRKRGRESWAGFVDGPDRFPNSVVYFTEFKVFLLQAAFGYLRHQEERRQKELEAASNERERAYYRAKLEAVEEMLIFFAHNFERSGGRYDVPPGIGK